MGKKIAYVVVRRLLKCHISRTKTACRLICTYIIHILCNYTLPIYRCMHVLRVSGRELMEVILGSGSKSFDQFLALLLLAAATCLHPARTLDLFLRGPIPKREKSVRHSSRSRSSPPNGFVAPAVGGAIQCRAGPSERCIMYLSRRWFLQLGKRSSVYPAPCIPTDDGKVIGWG